MDTIASTFAWLSVKRPSLFGNSLLSQAMGEARRRVEKGLPPRQVKRKQGDGSRFFSWLPTDKTPREQFYSITKAGAWIGIGLLAVVWIVVRFVGPAAGWWTPADVR